MLHLNYPKNAACKTHYEATLGASVTATTATMTTTEEEYDEEEDDDEEGIATQGSEEMEENDVSMLNISGMSLEPSFNSSPVSSNRQGSFGELPVSPVQPSKNNHEEHDDSTEVGQDIDINMSLDLDNEEDYMPQDKEFAKGANLFGMNTEEYLSLAKDVACNLEMEPEPKKHEKSQLTEEVRQAVAQDEEAKQGEGLLPPQPEQEMDIPMPPSENYHPYESNQCNNEMLREFKEYCQEAPYKYFEFLPHVKAGIDLMKTLSDRRTPLNLYDDIMKWHVNYSGNLHVSQQSIVKELNQRYNETSSRPVELKGLTLPYSKAKVTLVRQDAKSQIVSILTDPRIVDSDYLFHNNDPFCPPPAMDASHKYGDINTGTAYRAAYREFVKDPHRDVLMPIVYYIDGAVSGQYDNLPIEALKLTLGIFKRKARDNKRFISRNIGYVTQYVAAKTKGLHLIKESKAVDADAYVSDEEEPSLEDEHSEEEENEEEEELCESKAQDWHFMLKHFLAPYKELQNEGGFEWELRYRGKTHKVRFIPFVIFVKGDTQEHDKHCGHMLSRTHNIQQLCRYCCIPNAETDNPYAKRYPLKTPEMIQPLVDTKDLEGLRALSQNCIDNTWYDIIFSPISIRGIHGATPIEILHWIQIGKFPGIRDMFFDQVGPTSQLADELDAVACAMGFVFARQSDRILPRTRFSKGIRRGKLMAHEYSGVMLILLAVLRSTKGQELLLKSTKGKAKVNLAKMHFIKDWIMLLETLLEWEQWLKSDEIIESDRGRYETKVKELMNMERTVGKRSKGMGSKTIKFHGGVHNPMDIRLYASPLNANTSSDESGHKASKTASKRTQRRPKVFDFQIANQIHRMNLVDLAHHEINTGRSVWNYFDREEDPAQQEMDEFEENDSDEGNNDDRDDEVIDEEESMTDDEEERVPLNSDETDTYLGGYTINFATDEDYLQELDLESEDSYPRDRPMVWWIKSEMSKKDKIVLDTDFLEACDETLYNLELAGIDHMKLYTEYTKEGHKFRASPLYRGKPWRDWVLIKWKEHGILPCLLWGFLDLRDIPEEAVNFGHPRAVIAIVERSYPIEDEKEVGMSEIFVPFMKGKQEGKHGGRQFFYADVEDFHHPACVIPDLGNPNPRVVLYVKPRKMWTDMFVEWLREDHSKCMMLEEEEEQQIDFMNTAKAQEEAEKAKSKTKKKKKRR